MGNPLKKCRYGGMHSEELKSSPRTMVKVLTYKECTSGMHEHTRIDPWGAAKVEWRKKWGAGARTFRTPN